MKKTTIISLLLILLGSQMLSADENSITLERFRLLKTDGVRIEGRQGIMTQQGLEGVLTDGMSVSIARDEIRALDRYMGNKATSSMLIGAGVGFGTAMVSYLIAKSKAASDPFYTVDESKVAPIFIGCTLGGGLIGFLIGSSTSTWERVPLETNLGFKPEPGGGKLYLTMSF